LCIQYNWIIEKHGLTNHVITEDALDVTGLDVISDDMKELLGLNKEEWQAEVASIKEHYASYQRMPEELLNQLKALEERIESM
jgi:phosphoenolpyruvate carboxykinase (GTP)